VSSPGGTWPTSGRVRPDSPSGTDITMPARTGMARERHSSWIGVISGEAVGSLPPRFLPPQSRGSLPQQSRVERGGTDGPGSSPSSTVVPVTAPPGSATSALLIFDTEQCRNGGTVEAFGEVWQLAASVPRGWRTSGERYGMLTVIDSENATFIADDGTELRVTLGAQEDICFTWDGPASSEPPR
jgi:hypothetical protein